MAKRVQGILYFLIFGAILNCSAIDHNKNKETAVFNCLEFTENKGQVRDQNFKKRTDVLYSTNNAGLGSYFRKSGVSFQIFKRKPSKKGKLSDSIWVYRIDLDWLGMNKDYSVLTDKIKSGYKNFYSETVQKNVRSYAGIWYKNLYKGIDLHYFEQNGELKYDYLIAPGANYKSIKVKVAGAQSITIGSKGQLVISTPYGSITEHSPIVFQNGKQLKAYWKVCRDTVSFEIKEYDPKSALVIDPVVRLWGTYYGGSNGEVNFELASDGSGNIVTCGATDSPANIATTGAFQTAFGGGTNDAYIAKFSGSGTLLWSSYYGGNAYDRAQGVCTDKTGNIYMCGTTTSSTGISTPTSHQPSISIVNYTFYDGFLVKFDAAGNRIWATYYGGAYGCTDVNSCVCDKYNNVYIAGGTNSYTEIATPGAFQPTVNLLGDAYLVKFDSSGTRIWSTYYGGNNSEYDPDCAVDTMANVYLVGTTKSPFGLGSAGCYQFGNGGSLDGFIAKFDPNGLRLWGTYYGSVNDEAGRYCATDKTGNVYLVGSSSSTNGITTPFSHQPNYGGGVQDGYFVKFSTGGVRIFSSYFGGGGEDNIMRCCVDKFDNFYVSGYTGSAANISTPNGFQSTYVGTIDPFLAFFNSNGVRQSATYYGGPVMDDNYGCVTDSNNDVYISGNAGSTVGISTPTSYQPNINGGGGESFIVKFAGCTPPPSPVSLNNSSNLLLCAGQQATLLASSNGSITWYTSPTGFSSIGTGTAFVTSTLSAGIYTYYSEAKTCVTSNSRIPVTVTVNLNPAVSAFSSDSVICSGSSSTLTGLGADTYSWSNSTTSNSIVVSPTVTTTYTLIGNMNYGCSDTLVFTQNVVVCTGLDDHSRVTTIKIFPNPFHDTFNIHRDNSLTQPLALYSAQGCLLMEKKLTKEKEVMDLNSFDAGIYFLKIESECFKLIKE